jgi:hypothetical protein
MPLTGALSNDGAEVVTPGGARYQALYLGGSSRHMTLPTLRKLAALVEGGANVVGLPRWKTPALATMRANIARWSPSCGRAAAMRAWARAA